MSWITLPDGRRIGTGDRVRMSQKARFTAKPLGTYSLSGAQMKLAGTLTEAFDVTGEVMHVRGNHPTAPDRIWVYVKPDDVASTKDFRSEECARHACTEFEIEITPDTQFEITPKEG